MAGGKKAAYPTKATPADSLAETPTEPTETTRDTTTLALLQALALKVAALSTRLDEQDNNKHKEHRDIPSDDDEVGEGGKEPEHDARTAAATGGARDAAAAKKALTPEEQVAERLIYSRVFDNAEHERSANVVDGLLAALEDKRLEVGLAAAAKAQASATFKRQAAERDTDRDKARKEKEKAARERREQQRREADAKNRDKNGGRTGDKTRDRRSSPPNKDALRRQAWEKSSCAWWVSRAFFVPKPGDNQWRFIIDLPVLNTFCARKRLRMETLMGVRHLTAKGDYRFSFDLQDGFYALGIAPSDRDYFTVNICGTLYWLGARILPYVDDFFLFASSEPEALELRQRVADLLDSLGLQRNPAKGLWEPVQYGQHLGVDIDTATGYFYAPVDKRASACGSSMTWWAPSGAAECGTPVRRDLQWWTAVPTQPNGRPIHRPVETAYMHCDSSGYGWGAVLNGKLEARGFWGAADERQHITWKELKAVRLAVESFLPHLAGRRMRTSRRARYIWPAANVWADRLSRHLDSDDWQMDPVMFAELEAMWGAHSVDRFASAMNAMLPRYDAPWLDPGCEAVDSLHLSDAEWRRENNYCNPPWPLLPDLVQKPRQSRAAATVVAIVAAHYPVTVCSLTFPRSTVSTATTPFPRRWRKATSSAR
eukprot:jgi/Tetstr1/443442/TSEL_031453.t1